MPTIKADSATDKPAITAKNTSTGAGVWSNSETGASVIRQSKEGRGVLGESNNAQGVWGVSHAKFHGGVTGVNDNQSQEAGPGVYGQSRGTGIWGESETWHGVFGTTKSTTGGAGVHGLNTNGAGVFGQSQNSIGVLGISENHEGIHAQTKSIQTAALAAYQLNPQGTGAAIFAKSDSQVGGVGVWGSSQTGIGVVGMSETHEGVHAETKSTITAGLAAYQKNPTSHSAALFAKHEGGGVAGRFEGDVEVTGDIRLINADIAEDFTIADPTVEVGTVMIFDANGFLTPCYDAYDKKVVGVISGAGDYKPGMVLDKQVSSEHRMPIALLGKVFCKLDAQYGAVEVGDLLTTSPTLGHAMKASNPYKAFGSVIGKALRGLTEGQGLVPVLIALQ